jgi:hypothetical protein
LTEQSEDDDGAQIHERRNLFVSCSAPARRGRVRDVSIRARRGTGQTRSPNGEEVTRVVGAYHAPVSAHKYTRTNAIISYEEHFREMIRFDSSHGCTLFPGNKKKGEYIQRVRDRPKTITAAWKNSAARICTACKNTGPGFQNQNQEEEKQMEATTRPLGN